MKMKYCGTIGFSDLQIAKDAPVGQAKDGKGLGCRLLEEWELRGAFACGR